MSMNENKPNGKVQIVLALIALAGATLSCRAAGSRDLEAAFRNPPNSARPGVYWYFMDGNLDRQEMVKDLESMKEVGLGNLWPATPARAPEPPAHLRVPGAAAGWRRPH